MPGETVLNPTAIVGAVAEATMSQLKQTAEAQLEKLVGQAKNITSLKSNLDLLMERYNIGKSYFSQASDWYGEKQWWAKTGLAIAFVGVTAAIGAIANMAIICGIIGFCVYSLITFFLINHHNATLTRDKRFCNDIVEMESTLASTIESLSKLENDLNKVLVSLCNENIRLADSTTVYESQIAELGNQVNELTQTVKKLEATKDELCTTHGIIKGDMMQANHGLQASHVEISNQSTLLGSTGGKLAESNVQLDTSAHAMGGIEQQYQHHLQNLSSLEDDIQEQLDILRSATQTAHKDENDNQPLQATEQALSDVDTILMESERYFSELEAEDTTFTPEKNAILSRAKAQLARANIQPSLAERNVNDGIPMFSRW